MDTAFPLASLLASYLLPQSLPIIIYITAIVLAVTRWNDHPQVSRWAIAGFGLMLLGSLINTSIFIFGQFMMLNNGWSAAQISVLYGAQSLLSLGIATCAWVCILVAVFGWRRTTASTSF